MIPPKNQKQVHSFIGIVNYYMDMWAKQSYLLQPLTVLTSMKVKFKWTVAEQKSFDDIKIIVEHITLLAYPDLNNNFDIHTEDRNLQLRSFIRQGGISIAFYSRKITIHQNKFTVTEKELLIIVETLKYLPTIFLSQQ